MSTSGIDPGILDAVRHLRTSFDAAAASCALVEPDGATLRFSAAVGAGADAIVGRQMPTTRGIAGWTATAGEPIAVNDVTRDARFARDVAEATDYLPNSILCAPILSAGEVLGVVQVLDPAERGVDVGADLTRLSTAAAELAAVLGEDGLPEWSADFLLHRTRAVTALPLPAPVEAWAWGSDADRATGRGVKVAIIDSGVDGDHPRVGGVAGAVSFEVDPDAENGYRIDEGPHEDYVGHGTACAAIIRSLAPEVEIYSVRVLGENLKGRGALFCAGLEWALDAGMDVLNLSLSSGAEQWYAPLHDLVDRAYFQNTMVVCAANNMPGPTYPSQYSSVISVAARVGQDPERLTYNSHPPVEFGARGLDVEVAWSGGGTLEASGNSFATPHVAGLVARILSKHPELTPFQLKAVLHALADNAS